MRMRVLEVKERSILLDDASGIFADVIILATGCRSMNGSIVKVITKEPADTVGEVWGMGF